MTSRVVVVTDSAASLPEPLARRWNVSIVPLEVAVDGEPLAPSRLADLDYVLDALEARQKVTTSQPSVGAFTDAYAAAAEQGASHIVSVHVTQTISGTVNAARLAAKDASIPVTVVDSGSVGMGTGWPALAAAAKAKSGVEAEKVADEARRVAASVTMLFTVDSLEYLKRGGRVAPTVAAIGDALNIRPVLTVKNGELVVLQRVRSTPRARALVVDHAERAIARFDRPALAIMGLRAQAYADDIAASLEVRHPKLAMLVRTPVTSVLAVHGGPGSFAAVVADIPRELL